MTSTRRTFLKHATTAAAAMAGAPFLPPRWLDERLSADQWIDAETELYDEAEVRALAQWALDAAKSAGATYADVRINQGRMLVISVGTFYIMGGSTPITDALPMNVTQRTMGVRAMIDGTWGFAGNSALTPDGAATVARVATAYARDGRRRTRTRWGIAPAPAVPDGRWETPIEIDPFTIPVGELLRIYREGMTAAARVQGSISLGGQPTWAKSERLFASTEGSVIAQRVYESNVNVAASAHRPSNRFYTASAGTNAPFGGYGYETLAKLDLKSEWPRVAEEAARLASLPYKAAEVGRYDLVLGADAMAFMLHEVGRALELDRALGEKANSAGTTFAIPPQDIVGRFKLGATSMTVVGDRSRPHAAATIGWDEEGVKPEEFTLVQDGTVVDYITTRSTAPALADWYARRGGAVRSHGCAARTGGLQPILQLPNLTLKPGPGATSVEDLIKEVKRGYYIESGAVSPDQQELNMEMIPGAAYEIVSGKLGAAVVDMGMQCALPRFWQNLVALGGAASAKISHLPVDSPDLDRLAYAGLHTVPALVRGLNVINLGRET